MAKQPASSVRSTDTSIRTAVVQRPAWLAASAALPVYLVSSQAQADSVQQDLNDTSVYLGQASIGDAPKAIIAVVTSSDQESGLLRSVAEAPAAHLVDLRAP
jgi:hypothetical protein